MSETKLAAIPTHVRPSVDKDGRKRPAHISRRHKKVAFSVDSAPAQEATNPLDGFIAKHGGVEHLRESLEAMTPDQRAKLLDAMAHVDGTDAAAVMKKLGIHEPQTSADQAAIDEALEQFQVRLVTAKEEGVITSDEYDVITAAAERDGVAAALAALQALRVAPASDAQPVPTEVIGDMVVDGTVDINGNVTIIGDVVITPAVPAATANEEEGAAGIRASLQAQAGVIYQKHVDATNAAVRADFEVEKRQIRGWKTPAQMTEAAAQSHRDAEAALNEWRRFCEEHDLGSTLF